MRVFNFFSTLFIIFLFSQCRSLKLEEKPPFKIISATYQNWLGGQPGVSGTNVKIIYKTYTSFQFDSIYFSNKVAKLEAKDANRNTVVFAYFNTSSFKNDLVLDVNPINELNNPIPEIKKIPFELKENEAVISYKTKGKIRYYKIKYLVKEKQKIINR